MTTLLESFRAWLRASPYAPRTQATYLPIIEEFISENTSSLPAFEDVERFLQNQRQDGLVRSSTGWNQRLAALRLLATHAKQHRYWDEDPTEAFAFRRGPVRRVSVLSVNELEALFDATPIYWTPRHTL
jgi:site-specific recombinase XerD